MKTRYLVIYDISDDNLRTQVSELLKDYGLVRVQKSAFVGLLSRRRLNSLLVDLKKIIGRGTDNVQVYPLCDSCYRGRRTIGKPTVEAEGREAAVLI